MAELVESRFTKWRFEPEEEVAAKHFSTLNYQHIQNELAIATESKMLVAYNPDSNNADREFQGEHEYWRGYMAALNLLLTLSKDARDQLEFAFQQAREQTTQNHNQLDNQE